MVIQVLPADVADQIAAGEVVERPASIIKELIENCIDAQATQVVIKLLAGGKNKISVQDNGIGMSPEDAAKACLRHATSKVSSIDDLFHIQSFGFRGEALAAISAVSCLTLTTKMEDREEATQIVVKESLQSKPTNVGANTGTTILIEGLFEPVPARKAYLKSDEAEYRECLKAIKQIALAHPQLDIEVWKEEKQVIEYHPCQNLTRRIAQVLKKQTESFTSVEGSSPDMKISGSISRPEFGISTRTGQYLFVNGRPIEDRSLSFAVREAYHQSCGIEKHLHPLYVIFIDIDPILVDVNVHPRKREVKFAEPRDIFSLIKRTCSEALTQNSQTPFTPNPQRPSFAPTPAITNSYSKRTSLFGQSFTTQTPSFRQQSSVRDQSPINDTMAVSQETSLDEVELGELKLIGQITNKYIAAEGSQGLFLFDQHALHERQRFEIYWKKFEDQKDRTQKLLINQNFTFSEDQISILHEHQQILRDIGFQVSFPNDETISIEAIPLLLEKEDLQVHLEKLVEHLEGEQIGEHSIDSVMRRLVEYKACRGSIMFGDTLQPEEMQHILDDLKNTKFKWLCAHGRPNYWFIPFDELDHKFHR